jgi:hypothetical protein
MRECPVIRVSGDAYREICIFAPLSWASSKRGSYGKGMTSTPDDPYRTARVGWVCHAAVSRQLGVPMVLHYEDGGDAHDLIYRSYPADSKGTERDYGGFCVTCKYPSGRKTKLKSDLYIYSIMIGEDREAGYADVVIIGFCTRDDVLRSKQGPGESGEHDVYNVSANDTKEIAVISEWTPAPSE